MLYRAFISYSHAADGRLAPALQSGLQRFTKPWYRLRAMRVFRDETGLGLTAQLWPEIEEALRESEYFLLLASPDAAKSKWVAQEVDFWLKNRSPSTILIIWTEGDLRWDDSVSDFVFDENSPLPRRLEKVFSSVPFYLDFQWARSSTQLSLREPRFLDAIATIASTLYGKPKDELSSQEVFQFRRSRRLVRYALGTLSALTLVASVATFLAVTQRNTAQQQRKLAVQRLIQMSTANGFRLQDEGDICRSLLWFLEALALEAGDSAGESEQRTRLGSTLTMCPQLAQVWQAKQNVQMIGGLNDGRRVVAFSAKDPADPRDTAHWGDLRRLEPTGMQLWDTESGAEVLLPGMDDKIFPVDLSATPLGNRSLTLSGNSVEVRNADSGAQLFALEHAVEVSAATFDGENHIVTIASDQTVHVWDAGTGRESQAFPHSDTVFSASLSSDARKLLVVCANKTVYVWDTAHQTNLAIQLSGPGLQAQWSGDGKRVFTLTTEGEAKVWDSDTGETVTTLGDLPTSANWL